MGGERKRRIKEYGRLLRDSFVIKEILTSRVSYFIACVLCVPAMLTIPRLLNTVVDPVYTFGACILAMLYFGTKLATHKKWRDE